MKILKFVFMIFLTQLIHAQEKQQKFQVDFNEIKGELTSKDLFKKDFGRYDGYEIELFEGEAVNFVAYSKEFQPALAFVNPKGAIFQHSTANNKNFASIITTISASGVWILYVIGDEKSSGSYTLQTAIAEPAALSLSSDADFCVTLDFLLAHSSAYFLLLENLALTERKLVKLNDAVDAFIDDEDGSYNASYYDGNELSEADAVFKNISEKIKSCTGKNWQMKSASWNKVEDYREKSVTFTEKSSVKTRYITIAAYDFAGAAQKFKNRFSVEVKINRKP
ncbi:MAG: hypothetical protein AB1298_08050 [Bacteroidota bacterium]